VLNELRLPADQYRLPRERTMRKSEQTEAGMVASQHRARPISLQWDEQF
jgi:hypothetical protein